MNEQDDTDLGNAIPTRFNKEVEAMLLELVQHTGLDRTQIVRRGVRLLIEEVKKRGGADWLKDQPPKPALSFLDPSKVQKPRRAKEKRSRLTDIREISLGIFGAIPAGWPDDLKSAKPSRTVMVAKGRFPDGSFGLDVKGDSMNKATGKFGPIMDGQTVVLLAPELREPRHGDIVAALIDGQTTLKRLDCELATECVLRAESDNPEWKNCMRPAQELLIQGVVVGKL